MLDINTIGYIALGGVGAIWILTVILRIFGVKVGIDFALLGIIGVVTAILTFFFFGTD